jgi:hypothetical protein
MRSVLIAVLFGVGLITLAACGGVGGGHTGGGGSIGSGSTAGGAVIGAGGVSNSGSVQFFNSSAGFGTVSTPAVPPPKHK